MPCCLGCIYLVKSWYFLFLHDRTCIGFFWIMIQQKVEKKLLQWQPAGRADLRTFRVSLILWVLRECLFDPEIKSGGHWLGCLWRKTIFIFLLMDFRTDVTFITSLLPYHSLSSVWLYLKVSWSLPVATVIFSQSIKKKNRISTKTKAILHTSKNKLFQQIFFTLVPSLLSLC